MSKFSVKKPFTIFVAVVFVLVMGAVSFTRMSTDLLPNISLPYVVVVTTYPGASPEKVESTVTEPLEAGLGTVNGVANVTSVSNENYSMVMLEFEEDTNMDSAMVKLSSAMDLIPLPDETGTPMIMELSMDMMPVMYASVSYEGMDIYELTDFVEENVVPEMERQNGVASVDAMGAVEKTVEIRLDQEKIDGLNDKLAAYVSDELADAKAEIDDAKQELSSAKADLNKAEKDLEKQQTDTANQLAESSKLVDQAVATQSAYSAQLNSLKASVTALEAEKKAYEDAKVSENYTQLDEAIKGAYAGISQYAAMTGMNPEDYPTDISDAIAHPEKLTALKTYMEQSGQAEAAAAFELSTLQQLQSAVNRLPQIETELSNLNIEVQAAEAALNMVNEQVSEAVDNYAQLEAGKINAAAGFGSGAAQIASGKSTIESSEKQLDDAMEAYEKGRETALKNANLDALLSLDTLSGLIYAQNFAMPAGYIYEGENQYLLKVGEEFASKEELEQALLCDVDGIGEVRLQDVAAVTWIDNAGDQYTKVNGEQGVVITISKASTAGTSAVSDVCGDAINQLMEKYDGLQITTLMDQGDYIDLIVKSVLQNLLVGAILAIVVLAIFLRSIKPTIVVAFSIPLSVLVAIVLMYFSGITLNTISLSGLALGIGMLVDNSIVVIENIYRLRGKGVTAARAAVMGAKQVAGAITASTLTTICVFLPIVFTSGLVKQLFVDMALTIAYSLVASLLIALTVVPAMSSTLLKKDEPKEQKLLNKVLQGYEKALRFCLRRKFVPIIIAVVLLLGCVWKAVNTGMILLPAMGGNQMSVTMTMKEELSDEEAYAVADQAMEQMTAVEGVEYIGIMSGTDSSNASATSLLTSTGGTHNMTVYVLVDDAAAKDNSKVADRLDEICAGLDLEDYSVSKSNMDISSYLETGLSVNIYGDENEKLIEISKDVMDIVSQVEGFEGITNGQEDADETVELVIDKDQAMKYGLTIAQVVQELSSNLTTEKTATQLTVDGKQYDVVLVNENEAVDTDSLMDYEFAVDTKDEDGNAETEYHKLSEFAKASSGTGMASIRRENQRNYITVSAETMDGYNTTLLSRQVEEKLESYKTPEGYTIEIGGEMEQIYDALKDMILMIALAVIFIYLIMVAQFQSMLSPFIVIFTIPLAFTGGFLGIFIAREDIALTGMMGFLMLAGIIVNNGIVFVDYANQMRLDGMEKREALIETGRSRMRPILMTMLTTVLAMSTMLFSTDAAAAMSRGMAVVVIGGLLYATLMTLFIVPVLYDLLFRRELKRVDIGTEEELKEQI